MISRKLRVINTVPIDNSLLSQAFVHFLQIKSLKLQRMSGGIELIPSPDVAKAIKVTRPFSMFGYLFCKDTLCESSSRGIRNFLFGLSERINAKASSVGWRSDIV